MEQASLFTVYMCRFGSECLFAYRYASCKYVVFSRSSNAQTIAELMALYGAEQIQPHVHYSFWEVSNALRK